jgi:hypothetical protein
MSGMSLARVNFKIRPALQFFANLAIQARDPDPSILRRKVARADSPAIAASPKSRQRPFLGLVRARASQLRHPTPMDLQFWPGSVVMVFVATFVAGGFRRMRTESLASAFAAHWETDFRTPETKGPNHLHAGFLPHRDRRRANAPAPNRGKSRVFRGDGKIRVARDSWWAWKDSNLQPRRYE